MKVSKGLFWTFSLSFSVGMTACHMVMDPVQHKHFLRIKRGIEGKKSQENITFPGTEVIGSVA